MGSNLNKTKTELNNEVETLLTIKNELETSLLEMNSKVENVIRILKDDIRFSGSIDKRVTIGNCIQLIKNEFSIK